MGRVMILCPKTGRHVFTGVEISRARFNAMPDVKSVMECWACGGEHNWSKRWAVFVSEATDERPRRARPQKAKERI